MLARHQALSLAQQYMLASLVVLVLFMATLGWWVSGRIEAGVVHETGATTALYVDSFVAPLLQELDDGETLSPANTARLDRLLTDTQLGQHILSLKVWNREGKVLYSTLPGHVGRVYPVDGDLLEAWEGKVHTGFSRLDEEEQQLERALGHDLLEIYSPVRRAGSAKIIAVAEFYQSAESVQASIASARVATWLVILAATSLIYLALAGIVRRGSATIARQQEELRDKVRLLTALLAENRRLGDRVHRAVTGATARNEAYLRRLSSELHDGPAQAVGAALLRLDSVMANSPVLANGDGRQSRVYDDLRVIETSLRDAMSEIRAQCSGLALPELEGYTLPEAVLRAVQVHERRTGTQVALSADGLPQQASLPMKITVYRLVQEGLTNAFRHAGGKGQKVHVRRDGADISVEIADSGPGFHGPPLGDTDHLGLAAMRERTESLGGVFNIHSAAGAGSAITARLPLQPLEQGDERRA
jgi:signal transduction histidine kinase